VCQLSQKIQGELAVWQEKGYVVSETVIRFIVAWRPKDAPKEEKEHAVLLVDLTLRKETNGNF
jgi:ATP-dependent DNA helicase RecQ